MGVLNTQGGIVFIGVFIDMFILTVKFTLSIMCVLGMHAAQVATKACKKTQELSTCYELKKWDTCKQYFSSSYNGLDTYILYINLFFFLFCVLQMHIKSIKLCFNGDCEPQGTLAITTDLTLLPKS